LNAKFFEELKIPLIVVATDLISGEPVEICCGDLPSAVRASCSFPGFFKPYPLYGRHCIDGGASCPIPVAIAKKYGAKVVLAIDLSEKLPAEHPTNLFGVTRRGLEIAYRKFVEQSLAMADISIRMNFEDLGTFNDDQNHWLYQQGQDIIRAHLPDIKTKLHMAKLGLPSKRKAIERQITFGLESLDILPETGAVDFSYHE
jgi:NTE family protein